MAQDDDGRTARPDFVCGKPAAQHGRHAQKLEQVGRREQRQGLQWFGVGPQPEGKEDVK